VAASAPPNQVRWAYPEEPVVECPPQKKKQCTTSVAETYRRRQAVHGGDAPGLAAQKIVDSGPHPQTKKKNKKKKKNTTPQTKKHTKKKKNTTPKKKTPHNKNPPQQKNHPPTTKKVEWNQQEAFGHPGEAERVRGLLSVTEGKNKRRNQSKTVESVVSPLSWSHPPGGHTSRTWSEMNQLNKLALPEKTPSSEQSEIPSGP